MFGIFRCKPKTVKEDFEKLALDLYRDLRKMLKRGDIESLDKCMKLGLRLGSVIAAIRNSFPNACIDPNSLAMRYLDSMNTPSDQEKIEASVSDIKRVLKYAERNPDERAESILALFSFSADEALGRYAADEDTKST